jgi:hypothetical protein
MRTVVATTALEQEEPTLAAAIRSLAHGRMSGRFYQCLELAIPAAVQFAMWGWWRSAGWMLVVSAFGIWGICDQALERAEEERTSAEHLWFRIGRALAGPTGGLAASCLLTEAFGHLMGTIFRCIGCAG